MYCDPCDLEAARAYLVEQNAEVELSDREGVLSWYAIDAAGSMSLQGGTKAMAQVTAALYLRLWNAGVDVGLARDLACSYFDPRIGRQPV